jgi:GST-like protein
VPRRPETLPDTVPDTAPDTWVLYGSNGSGSAAVELALRRAGLPYRVVRASTWEADSAQAELARANPLGQIPTLRSPGGEVLTESAAILAELGLRHPASGLLPAEAAARARALRGLVYLAANCYAAIGLIDYPERWLAGGDGSAAIALRQGARARLHRLWELFADQFHDAGQPWLSGAAPGALDLLAAVVSRWSGTRAHLAAQRPALLALLQRVEALPEHAEVFARHFPPQA